MKIHRAILGIALSIGLASAAHGAPRVRYIRTLPAPHPLGADDGAVVDMVRSQPGVRLFLESFLNQTNRSGLLRVEDATYPAARRGLTVPVLLRIAAFDCTTREVSGQGSTRDADLNRVPLRQKWFEGDCETRIDVTNKASGNSWSFTARGSGSSPRTLSLSEAERDLALAQAAHAAAVRAAEQILPRRIREAITLDDAAPALDEGFALIDADRLAEARTLWEAALARNRTSAPLHFNLGAVCEASGDLVAARKYYQEAYRLAPGSERYKAEIVLFRRRHPQ